MVGSYRVVDRPDQRVQAARGQCILDEEQRSIYTYAIFGPDKGYWLDVDFYDPPPLEASVVYVKKKRAR
jgi:hypothetical protein